MLTFISLKFKLDPLLLVASPVELLKTEWWNEGRILVQWYRSVCFHLFSKLLRLIQGFDWWWILLDLQCALPWLNVMTVWKDSCRRMLNRLIIMSNECFLRCCPYYNMMQQSNIRFAVAVNGKPHKCDKLLLFLISPCLWTENMDFSWVSHLIARCFSCLGLLPTENAISKSSFRAWCMNLCCMSPPSLFFL